MSDSNYPKFCPVAMAASLLEPRWTMLLLCEMWSGSTRFNEIQRGVPGMSPGLLSKRLKEMEMNGLVVRSGGGPGAHAEYLTTPLADELEPLIRGLGEWAHRNIDCEASLQTLDARVLMWNIRRKIDLLQLPKRKSVIQFILKNEPDDTVNYWLVAKPGEETDLCYTDPKFDVDLFVVCELRALTAAWMGHSTFEAEIDSGRISLTGHDLMERTLTKWLIRSSFADVAKCAPVEQQRIAT
ncbi:winged helix-turn-helix transcriptional regulator [Celeribacter litoreus]|uniref:winged helix-turn-helix transcriptional regulator n=1 Tax=Celeribacter litoreus TaxID=2876714 RepID=UPI001CCA062A|nr:helix-turn-helix domain-containing protein [Celeribacter litoreus]MCA0042545.1 helix-turn-helix transcriptional regulator [Celeribacter litoreus]